MGAFLKSLTVLCIAALLPVSAAAGAAPSCLVCHPLHDPDRGRCAGCHRGDERTDRKNIAHRDLIPARYAFFTLPDSPVVREGAGRIERYACRRCHAWRGEGNALAANLDDLLAVAPPRKIHDSIRAPAAFMPDFGFDETQIRDIVNAILAAGRRRQRTGDAEIPVVVHFEDADNGTDLVFPKVCGRCHRMLSETAGGLGAGAVGPNLSGLLTPYYPKTFGGGERWTDERFRKWLGNPRSVKPAASMPPVPLSAEQAKDIAGLMTPTGAKTR